MTTIPSRIWDSTECALVLVDYQNDWLEEIHEQDPNVIAFNVITLADFAKRMQMPIVLSTVAVEMGYNGPTFDGLAEVLSDVEPIDRTTMNAWEDEEFVAAVRATGRNKLIMGGLLTSVCLTYPAISALEDGFEVMFVADAHGDVSLEAHDRACERMIQAGAIPSTTAAIIPELFRDWADPRADQARQVLKPYFAHWAELKHYGPVAWSG